MTVGSLRAMFSFFTMLRIDVDEDDLSSMNRNYHLVPLIGLFYGLLATVLLWALTSLLDPLVAAVTTLFAVSLMNRFLHLDGVMDLGDGLVVSGGHEDHVRALKDSRIGAGGVAFAVFTILLTVAAWGSSASADLFVVVLSAEIFSRNATVTAAAAGSPGNGMAGETVRLTGPRSVLLSAIISVALALIFLGAEVIFFGLSEISAISLLILMLTISLLAGWIMALVAERNFGMVNGDVLGATNELSRPLLVLVTLAVMTWMFL